MSVILVPTDQPNIASAIVAAAASGDEIVLEQIGTPFTGPNNRGLDPGGKTFLLRGETGKASDIVIDCQNAGRAFYIHNGEGRTLVFDSFTITNGLADPFNHGGAVHCSGTNPTFTNVIMDGNACEQRGGALYCEDAACPLLKNCLLINNQCTGAFASGGGVAVANPGTNPELENCTLYGNSAGHGGGIYATTSGQCTVTDSIIWGNTADTGAQIKIKSGCTVALNYCCYSNGVGDIFNEGTFNPSNCITSDPLWVAGPDGNYYLSQIAAGQGVDSPCVDTGSDTAVALGMDTKTTRTDEVTDSGQVDIGWHYEPAGAPPGPSSSMLGQTATG